MNGLVKEIYRRKENQAAQIRIGEYTTELNMTKNLSHWVGYGINFELAELIHEVTGEYIEEVRRNGIRRV